MLGDLLELETETGPNAGVLLAHPANDGRRLEALAADEMNDELDLRLRERPPRVVRPAAGLGLRLPSVAPETLPTCS